MREAWMGNWRRPSQHQEHYWADDNQQRTAKRNPEILSGMAHITHVSPAVMRGNQREQPISDRAAGKYCEKEPAQLISKRSRGQQEHSCRTRRGSYRGDKNSAGSPTLECVLHLLRASCTKFPFNPCETRFLAELIGKV